MKSYEIMDPELSNSFDSIDASYYAESEARARYRRIMDDPAHHGQTKGCVLVLVEQESESEADKARLDYMQNSKRCPWWDGALNCWGIGRDSGFKTMREAIDAARNAPPVKKTVIERPSNERD